MLQSHITDDDSFRIIREKQRNTTKPKIKESSV
jgi:hypothetical protein